MGLFSWPIRNMKKWRKNVESFANLDENLKVLKLNLGDIPYVLQYNKRDLPNSAPVDYMEFLLNKPRGAGSLLRLNRSPV